MKIIWSMALAIAIALAWRRAAHAADKSAEQWHSSSTDATCPAGRSRSRSIPLGENYADTFRVEDGMIKVSYDRYGKFDEQFGHLYSNQPYSRYVLRLEYRITGTAVADSPPWAKLNSGVMIHSQSPLSMRLEPALAREHGVPVPRGRLQRGRQTGNVCTPGTNLERKGKLLTGSHHRLHLEVLSPRRMGDRGNRGAWQ